MRSIWSNSWFTIPYLIFFIGGLVFSLLYPFGYELVVFNYLRTEPLNTFFKLATEMGEAKLWLIAVIGLIFWGNRHYALLLLLAAGIMAPFSWIIKHYIGVPRPSAWLDSTGLHDMVAKVPGVDLLGGYNSMPSGHTMLAFALFSLSTLMLRPAYRVLGLLFVWSAVLVAISRVFLVQHFLRDVLAGSVFGLLIGDFVWQIFRKYHHTRLFSK